MKKSESDRFWSKVDKKSEAECWNWKAALDTKGYGQFNIGNKLRRGAHRVAFRLHFGFEPRENILHICDIPSCCNPHHLKEGSQKENIQDYCRKNRIAHGERHGMVRLTKKDVLEILQRIKTGEKQVSIAKSYGVHPVTINDIVNKRTWKRLITQHGSQIS